MTVIFTAIKQQRNWPIFSDRGGNLWIFEMDTMFHWFHWWLWGTMDDVFVWEDMCGAAEFLAQSKMVFKHVTWGLISENPVWSMITIVFQFFKAIQSGRSCINSTLKSQLSNRTRYCFSPAHLHFNWMKITDGGALWRHGSRQKLGRQEARAAGEGEWAEGRQWKTHIVHPRTHS